MASVVDSIAQYIATDLNLGALGTVVFEDNLPDQPDTAICVYSLPGQPPDLAVGIGMTTVDRPGFQIASRSLSADTAIANELTIYQALHGLASQTIHGTTFVLVAAVQSGPMGLGRDEKQRFVFARSYRTITQGAAR